MITHLIKSINWIDVALLILLVRIIFAGVQNGFISEFFKSLGIVVTVFVSLHYYSFLAALIVQKTHLHWPYWDLAVFAVLWVLVTLFFRLMRLGLIYLFKVETNHEGFNKYAAGVVAVGRGILVSSLTLFLILLMHHGFLTRMAMRSYSFKITGHAAVGTYTFLYNHLIDKLCPGEHYNSAGPQVLHPS